MPDRNTIPSYSAGVYTVSIAGCKPILVYFGASRKSSYKTADEALTVVRGLIEKQAYCEVRVSQCVRRSSRAAQNESISSLKAQRDELVSALESLCAAVRFTPLGVTATLKLADADSIISKVRGGQ